MLMAVALLVVPCTLAVNVVRFLWYAFRNRLNLRYYLLCAVVKAAMSAFTIRQIQHLTPPTDEVYKAWIRRKRGLTKEPALKQRLRCDIQPLPEGNASILWVGDRRKARKAVLFLHGGGYVMPSQAGHFECVWNAYILSGLETGTEVAVAFLHYPLAPAWKPPAQLRQAASALAEMLDAGFGAEDIVVGGDSAGGNLALQLLHHIVDPHPEACRITLREPLAAVFLVSPWVGCDFSGPSFDEHGGSDMLSRSTMSSIEAQNRVRGKESSSSSSSTSDDRGGWADPLEGRGAWLSRLDGAARKILITVGEREVLADQGRLLAKTIVALQTGVEVTLESDPKAAHDFFVLEGMLGEVGEAMIRMKRWFKSLL
ncbi:hypothetical protein Trco_003578 [Trichoderma cornu-damae]|uniref:Alpha/beta hydrolase fold-3 domain-containing protein n=1 Tax=Trichoderma cornu-damae TaxID=654480 RepID=A0A9P8QJ13_9HYPO|nr:hypothetical protein Trco_003578 [Trichoderma cornu-damae]